MMDFVQIIRKVDVEKFVFTPVNRVGFSVYRFFSVSRNPQLFNRITWKSHVPNFAFIDR